jgi:hypothetical protein
MRIKPDLSAICRLPAIISRQEDGRRHGDEAMAMKGKSVDLETGINSASEKQLHAAAKSCIQKSGSILAPRGKSAQREL